MAWYDAFLKGPIEAIIKPIGEYYNHKVEIKKIERQGEIELAKAKLSAELELAKAGQMADANWEVESIRNSGWKDEWFTILLSIPMVLCFIPGFDMTVLRGFAAIEQTPRWYQVAFLAVVGSAIGVRILTRWFDRGKDK